MIDASVSEWVRLSEFPSMAASKNKRSKSALAWWNKFYDGEHIGVYQVSLTKPKSLIHKDICYIGMSEYLPRRVSDLRTSAGKKNKVTHHNCGVFIRHSDEVSVDNVYVRCLFTTKDQRDALEGYLQDQHRIKYGYPLGFKWTEASGGHQSSRIQVISAVQRLDSIEVCEELKLLLDKRIGELRDTRS
jgi:hypothetical protein